MKNTWFGAFILSVSFLPGCASMESGWKSLTGASVERTFSMPIARVKPAFISTLTQMGMPISALEVRGKNEVVKSKKADKAVEIEFERLAASSTRVRVSGSDEATANQVMRETEKRLGSG